MQLSKFTDYAFRTLIYLGRNKEESFIIDKMASDLDISKDHLKKVINKLGKTEYIISTKGRNGGVKLGLEPKDINLGEVLKVTEENLNLVECMSDINKCPLMTEGCKLKGVLNSSLKKFLEEMSKYTLEDLMIK
ncbi:MAG: RrF2 family transcriptional regulator [Sarcina sp.]